jgi:hypothetical protein
MRKLADPPRCNLETKRLVAFEFSISAVIPEHYNKTSMLREKERFLKTTLLRQVELLDTDDAVDVQRRLSEEVTEFVTVKMTNLVEWLSE